MGHRDTLQQPQPGLTLPAATCKPAPQVTQLLAATSPLQHVPLTLSPGHTAAPTSDPHPAGAHHREQDQGRGQPQLGGWRRQPGRAGRTGTLSPLESQESQERQESTLSHSEERLHVHREGGEGRGPSLSGGDQRAELSPGPAGGTPPAHSLSPVTAPCPQPPLAPVCHTGRAPGGAGDPSSAPQHGLLT